MVSSEIYSVSMDTATGTVSEPLLLSEILTASLTTMLLGTRIDGDNLTITFLSLLPGGEKATLDSVVAAHQGPLPVTTDISATATNTVSTTSGSDILIPSMTITPGAGSYIVYFSGTGGINATGSGFISIYSNNVLSTGSSKEISGGTFFFGINTLIEHNLNTQAVVTVTDNQTIEARYRTTSTFEIRNRSIILIKLE